MKKMKVIRYWPLWWATPLGRIGNLAFFERGILLPTIYFASTTGIIRIDRSLSEYIYRNEVGLIILWVIICAYIQRLHDIGKGTGGPLWLGILLCFIIFISFNYYHRAELASLISTVLIVVLNFFLLSAPGNKLKNKHGLPPDKRKGCLIFFSPVFRMFSKSTPTIPPLQQSMQDHGKEQVFHPGRANPNSPGDQNLFWWEELKIIASTVLIGGAFAYSIWVQLTVFWIIWLAFGTPLHRFLMGMFRTL